MVPAGHTGAPDVRARASISSSICTTISRSSRARVLLCLGEVSQCNDDNTDNSFNPPVGRFPKIEEDEAPYRLLCNEYLAAKGQPL